MAESTPESTARAAIPDSFFADLEAEAARIRDIVARRETYEPPAIHRPLSGLSEGDRRQLIGTLEATGAGQSPERQAQVVDAYRSMRPDEASRAALQEIDGRVAQNLSGVLDTPEVQRARAEWPNLSIEERTRALQHVEGALAQSYPHSFDVSYYDASHDPRAGSATGRRVELHVGNASSFEQAVETLAHETRHTFQNSLAADIRHGRPVDPRLQSAAEIFAVNQDLNRQGAMGVNSNSFAYRHEPIEVDARVAGDSARQVIDNHPRTARVSSLEEASGRPSPELADRTTAPPDTPSHGTAATPDSRAPTSGATTPHAATTPEPARVSDASLAALRERIPPHMQAHVSVVPSMDNGVAGVRVTHHPNFTDSLPGLLGVPQADIRHRPGNTEGAAVFIAGDAVEASVRPTTAAAHTPPPPSAVPDVPESPQATAARLRAEGEARADALMAQERAAAEAQARETAAAGRETPPATTSGRETPPLSATTTEAPPRATAATTPTASVPTPEFQPNQGMLQSLQGGPYAGSGIVGAATHGSGPATQVQLTFSGDVSAAEAARRVGLTPEQVTPHLTSVGGNTALTLPRETLSQGNQRLQQGRAEAASAGASTSTPPAPEPHATGTTPPATTPPEGHVTPPPAVSTTPPPTATTPSAPDPDATIRPGAGAPAHPSAGRAAGEAVEGAARGSMLARLGGALHGAGAVARNIPVVGAVVGAAMAVPSIASAAVARANGEISTGELAGVVAGEAANVAAGLGGFATAELGTQAVRRAQAAAGVSEDRQVSGMVQLGQQAGAAVAGSHSAERRDQNRQNYRQAGRGAQRIDYDAPDDRAPISASVAAQAQAATAGQSARVTGGEDRRDGESQTPGGAISQAAVQQRQGERAPA
ncbi:MAG: hypothetical protein K2Q12_06950 [Rickettsiales bacterium]|nr:hypothetical protein [Rickettsiales bacterium]